MQFHFNPKFCFDIFFNLLQQVNGKQIVRSRTPSGSQEKRTPQCEVILTHSLVCRKTKREFIVTSSPDAAFVANLAKHIRMIQPGQVKYISRELKNLTYFL